jgi:hypothetical protein
MKIIKFPGASGLRIEANNIAYYLKIGLEDYPDPESKTKKFRIDIGFKDVMTVMRYYGCETEAQADCVLKQLDEIMLFSKETEGIRELTLT